MREFQNMAVPVISLFRKDTGSSTIDSRGSSNDGATSATSAWSDEDDQGTSRKERGKNGQSATTRISGTFDVSRLPAFGHSRPRPMVPREESVASIQTVLYEASEATEAPEAAVVVPERKKKKKRPCRKCLHIVSIILSNLFLLILVGLYTGFGSFLFYVIEGSRLPRSGPNMTVKRRVFALKLLANTEMPRNVTVAEASRWTKDAEIILGEFQALVTKLVAEAPRTEYKWTHITSAIYSVTLITTIGYGNITPQTNLGRVATVVYAMFGIPLTFLYLANIGDTMASLFKRLYSRLLRCCSKKTFTIPDAPDMVRVPVKVTVLILFVYIALGAVLFALWEHRWSWIIGGYFCFITLSTIGLGDFVFGFDEDGNDAVKQIVCGLYVLFGLSVVSMGFNLLQDEILHQYIDLLKKVGIRRQTMSRASLYPGERDSSDLSDIQ